jgi:hypothetical protein
MCDRVDRYDIYYIIPAFQSFPEVRLFPTNKKYPGGGYERCIEAFTRYCREDHLVEPEVCRDVSLADFRVIMKHKTLKALDDTSDATVFHILLRLAYHLGQTEETYNAITFLDIIKYMNKRLEALSLEDHIGQP